MNLSKPKSPRIVIGYFSLSGVILAIGVFISGVLVEDAFTGVSGNMGELMLVPFMLLLYLLVPIYLVVLILYFRSHHASKIGRSMSLVVLLAAAGPVAIPQLYEIWLRQDNANYEATESPVKELEPVSMSEAEALDLINSCHVSNLDKRKDWIHFDLNQAPTKDATGHPKTLAALGSWPVLKAAVDSVNGVNSDKCSFSTWTDSDPQH